MPERYDVLLLTDARLPGGTAASVAEEVRAQARAGMRTGLVHLDSHMIGLRRSFNPRVSAVIEEGLADLVVGPGTVHTDLAVLRHPGIVAGPDLTIPSVDARRTLVAVNQTPAGTGGTPVFYDLARAREVVADKLGDALWAPIGPLVRENLRATTPDLPLTEDDWVNVIDVDAWAVDPGRRWRRQVPVLGRHSRSHRHKWPSSPEEILAAYPEDPAYEVRILGGAEHAVSRLTRTPKNWTILPFGAVDPRRFLAELDAFVYFHHPDWIESFGRTVLEALASGAPAILPPHFAVLFGDVPVYTPAEGVHGVLDRWRDDPDDARAHGAAGQRLAADRFSYAHHAARVAALLPGGGTATGDDAGPARPRVEVTSPAAAQTDEVATSSPTPSVLFMSSNGSGVGHLMRLMSMASRIGPDLHPVFLTLSQAVPVVRRNGFTVEYIMSREYMGIDFRPWHTMLRNRIASIIEEHDVRALVFDGTWPYRGLLGAMVDHPDLVSVWSRRGMWRPGIDTPSLEHSDKFDLIIEPGEFSERFDVGATAARRDEVTRVGPLTFLDPGDLLPREEAAAALGLDPSRPAALLQLGAGNINDLGSLSETVTERLVREPDLQVCVTRSIIGASTGSDEGVIPIRGVYPLARYFSAFDLAVAASGYNTFHELLGAGVPTLFVPNHQTATDDQTARSSYAAAVGAALDLPTPDPASVDAALTQLLDPDRRAAMREQATRRYPANGAGDAMALIEHRVGTRATAPTIGATGDTGDGPTTARPDTASAERRGTRKALEPDVRGRPKTGAAATRARLADLVQDTRVRRIAKIPFRMLPTPVRKRVRRQIRRRLRRMERKGGPVYSAIIVPVIPGNLLPEDERTELDHVGVILPEGTDQREAVDRIAALQVAYRSFAPLIITFDDDLTRIRELKLGVEVIVPRERWEAEPRRRPWADHVRDRLRTIGTTYELDRMVTFGPVGDLDPMEALAVTLRKPR